MSRPDTAITQMMLSLLQVAEGEKKLLSEMVKRLETLSKQSYIDNKNLSNVAASEISVSPTPPPKMTMDGSTKQFSSTKDMMTAMSDISQKISEENKEARVLQQQVSQLQSGYTNVVLANQGALNKTLQDINQLEANHNKLVSESKNQLLVTEKAASNKISIDPKKLADLKSGIDDQMSTTYQHVEKLKEQIKLNKTSAIQPVELSETKKHRPRS